MARFVYFIFVCLLLFLGVNGAGNERQIPTYRLIYPADGQVLVPTDSIVFRWSALLTKIDDLSMARKISILNPDGGEEYCSYEEDNEAQNKSFLYTCYFTNNKMRDWDLLEWYIFSDGQYRSTAKFVHPPKFATIDESSDAPDVSLNFAGLKPFVRVKFAGFGNAQELLDRKNLILRLWSVEEANGFGSLLAEQKYDLDSLGSQKEFFVVSETDVNTESNIPFRLEACVDDICTFWESDGTESPTQNDDNEFNVTLERYGEEGYMFRFSETDPESTYIAYFYSDLAESPHIIYVPPGEEFCVVPDQYQYGTFYLRVIGVKDGQFTSTPTYIFKILETSPPDTVTLLSNGADYTSLQNEYFFQWDLNSWGTSNLTSDVRFRVVVEKDGEDVLNADTTSTFMSVSISGSGNVKLTVSPIKDFLTSEQIGNKSLTKEFTICDIDSFKQLKVGDVAYDETTQLLTWSFDGDVTKFCNIYGLWGFHVTLKNSAIFGSAEYVITDATSIKINKDDMFGGDWSATVDFYIAGELVSTSGSTFIRTTNIPFPKSCSQSSPALLNSFEVSREEDANTYPRPIKLKWDLQTFRNVCPFENTIVYMNGNPLTQLKEGVTGFTVPSHMLNPNITNHTFHLVTSNFKQDVNTSAIFIIVKDFIVIPPPVLKRPKLGFEQQDDNLEFEWELPQGHPFHSNSLYYDLLVGDSPYTMKQIKRVSGTSTTISRSLIPFSGGVYWTVKIVNVSEEEATVAAPPFSFLLFSGSAMRDPNIKVSYGTSDDPITFFWDYNPFMFSFGDQKSNDYVVLGKYNITVSCKDGSNSKSTVVGGFSNTVTFGSLNGCSEGFKYIFNVISSAQTNTFEETLNFLESGGSISLTFDNYENIVIAPFTVKWKIPNDGWKCDCSTGLCKSRIFVSTSKDGTWRYMDTVPFDSSLGGSYQYTIGIDQIHTSSSFKFAIVADNGYSVVSKTEDIDSGICVPSRPLMPIIMSPDPVALNQNRSAKFCIYPLFYFNDCNMSGDQGLYQLWIRDSATRKQEIYNISWDDISDGDDGSICINHYVEFNIWDWTVAAVNKLDLVSNVDSFSIYDACEAIDPSVPVWVNVSDGFVFSPYYIHLTWDFPNETDKENVFGHYCMSGNGIHEQKNIYLYCAYDIRYLKEFDESQFILGDNFGAGNFRTAGTISHGTFSFNTNLWTGAEYHFMIIVSNGAKEVYSEILTGFASNTTCDDLQCSSKGGYCNKTGPFCYCYPDFGGKRCETNVKRRDTIILAVSVSIAAFVLLIIAAIVVFFVVKKYYKTHKALMMKRPEFESLRTPPMKMPSFPPDLEINIDYDLVERAVFGENGLVMLWDILKNTSATEIDGMAKALVYSFQKQNKALELMAFLIICEITESTSSTVLFRANSPATRAFKYYSKMYALEYLYKTLAVLLQGIIRDVDDMEEEDMENGNSTAMEDFNEDVDEDDISSDENIGFLKIQLMSQKFFVQINRSDKACPGEIKHICACLQTQLAARYPDFVYQGIGAFVFLRFYNTAITVPESYGLLPEAPRPSVRKQLLAVTKVLQNLANGVLFGDKEQNMVKLNGFITSQRPAYEAFIQKLCDASAPLSDPVPISDESYKASLATIVNQLFNISRSDDTMLDRIQGIPDELRVHIRKMKASKKEQPQE